MALDAPSARPVDCDSGPTKAHTDQPGKSLLGPARSAWDRPTAPGNRSPHAAREEPGQHVRQCAGGMKSRWRSAVWL